MFRPPEAASPAPPVWERPHAARRPFGKGNFNPRSPCGERPRRGQGLGRGVDISIHAPRVGSDLALIFSIAPILISIHAPRVGSDPCIHERFPTPDNFNPRSPCGERRFPFRFCRSWAEFQSTLPVWGATVGFHADSLEECLISIHAPRVGSDGSPPIVPVKSVAFQSTLPVWGAT